MFGSTNPFGQSSTFGQTSTPFGQTSSSPFGQTSSSPFGQTSTSPFGSPTPFGQQPANTNNPFAPKPFGSPTSSPFGAQTGSSIFGGSSTGVFGQPSTPAFGASSSPAFGAGSSSSFGGSSLFGQKPAFGGFNSSPGQSTSPFGSTFGQTQSAFGSPAFGSTTPFGTSSTPAFGATSTPAFGATSTPAFGATSSPAFGATSTPAFGANTTPAFGSTSTSLFGNTGSAFGATSTQAFGAQSTPFGQSSTPAFGASSTPAFGAASTPAFGASSSSSFSFGSTPAFGQTQTGSTFGGSSPFGASPSPFGAQPTTPTFGSPGFGQQQQQQAGGSRITPFVPTPEEGATGTGATAKLESISAMPAYKDKSHEELRWEDYQRGDKGGPNPNPASSTNPFGAPAPTQSSPFGTTGVFGQTASNPFSSTAPSNNPFAPKPSTPSFQTGFGSTPSLFNSASSSAFGSSTPFGSTTSTATPSIFGAQTAGSPFGASSTPSIFGSTTTPTFGSTPSNTSSPFGSTFQTQTSGLFQTTAQPFGSTPSPFGQPATNTPSPFGQPATNTASPFGQPAANTASPFGQPAANTGFGFNTTPSTGFGGSLFSNSTPSLFPSSTPAFGQSQTAPGQTSSAFPFSNFGQQSQPAASAGGFGSVFTSPTPNTFGQIGTNQASVVMQPAPVTNPFGTLPAMPTMSIGRVGSTPSVQYGISSMPVSEKPAVTRTSTMLVPRHLSQRRIKLPPRRYNSKNYSPKLPYFADEDEVPSTPKADAFFIPRENPRSLIVRPIEQWPPYASPDSEMNNFTRDEPEFENQNGSLDGPSAPLTRELFEEYDNGTPKDFNDHPKQTQNGTLHTKKSPNEKQTPNGSLKPPPKLPKLTQADYFTIPRIPELATKERSQPGFITRVKDFTIGRENYGSIKFYGETDLTGLDLDALVQFGIREVVVYKDESVKPPVGEGLNKPAEVTMLNIKWVNKKTGQQYLGRDKVEKYTEILRSKTEEQGAEFVSYDAEKGEWKFKVKHF
ncbi:hypothetical protein LUZ60_015794 [Juncus effusus]|nr:hypothetical protein LUZ60_015794 [Juncus effusus]